VAAAAGVTVQTVLRRFGSKDKLFAAAARERSEEIRAEREAGRAGDVSHLVKHYERWGDEQLQLIAHEARTPAIRTVTDAARSYHHEWIARAYRPHLQAVPTALRRQRLAQLTAVTDLAIWGPRRPIRRGRRSSRSADQRVITSASRSPIPAIAPLRRASSSETCSIGTVGRLTRTLSSLQPTSSRGVALCQTSDSRKKLNP
jgi:AcrR family transcriptional regulator